MPMLFIRQKFDKVLVLLISAVGFCLLSYRPISSITPEMPKEFVDISSIGNRRQRLTEERVAKAYWDCVVNNIQWEYHYGSSLPQNPLDVIDRKSTRLNSSHGYISYAVFCLKKKNHYQLNRNS